MRSLTLLTTPNRSLPSLLTNGIKYHPFPQVKKVRTKSAPLLEQVIEPAIPVKKVHKSLMKKQNQKKRKKKLDLD
jgi:hypothetical protein